MCGRELCNAAASGNLPDVLFWLQNGADVNGLNKYKRTALQVVMLGSTSVVEALLAAGARPDVRDPVLGLTVTHDAARGGFAHTVRALLQHGANVDLVDDRGNLPLHLAATAEVFIKTVFLQHVSSYLQHKCTEQYNNIGKRYKQKTYKRK
uniref:Cyclin-dependent kinase inhibitor 2C (p18, inhibits CDK4) n=1 Tax=Scophthalmus maximus TaxID=52904 RepID=A0A8D3A1K6_SCOMX